MPQTLREALDFLAPDLSAVTPDDDLPALVEELARRLAFARPGRACSAYGARRVTTDLALLGLE